MTYKNGDDRRERIMLHLQSLSMKGYVPASFRELAKAVNVASTNTIEYHLNILEEQGRIKRDSNKARMIQIVEE